MVDQQDDGPLPPDHVSLIEKAAKKLAAAAASGKPGPLPSATSSATMGSPGMAASGTATIVRSDPAAASGASSGSGSVGPAPAAASPSRRPSVILDVARMQRNGIITPDMVRSRLMEEFRLIKRQLLARYLQDETSLANLVLVTSATPEEGKTFVALNLAMSLACERDFRVLLVDADLSHPSVLQTLGIEAKRGLIDVLTEPGLDLGQVLLRTDVPGLTILPPGSRHDYATELLASNAMARLMEEIAKRYADRLIIIDSPPVLLTTEASALAQHVGQIVFVIRAESTPQTAVREALNLVADCPHIGLLLNAATGGTGMGQFGAYYDKYYGSHDDDEGGPRSGANGKRQALGYNRIKRLFRNYTGIRNAAARG